MLVLTRKRGETVVLDGEIRVTVVALGRNAVRLGIEAPAGVTILREELLLDDDERAARAAWDGAPAAATQNT